MFDTEVKVTGPLFDGRAPAIIRQYMHEAVNDVAQDGENMIHQRLGQVLRNPTGYYESRIQTERRMTEAEVNDGGVIYGPWLEGVGSRNATTRFKGYHTFRTIAQRLNARARPIAGRSLSKYVGRL